ncbi:MAG: nucleoside kinase [Clostridiales bacterium]|nr:nucleoside kinase [Clostridiales bacterium]
MNIRCGEKSMEVEGGMTVMQCLLALGVDTQGVLAVQQQGRVLELNDPVTRAGELRPLTLQDEEGRRIYERSLRFVALLAFRRLMPGQRVRIEYSVGGGVFLHTPGHALTEAEVAAIQAEMRRITQSDLPFDKREWSLDDAIAYFAEDGQIDKVELLQRRTTPFFNMYECGGMWEYFYGAMLPSTGGVGVFGVQHLPGRGMALLTAEPRNPTRHAAYINRPKHLAVFDQSARWCAILGVRNAPDIHEMLERKQFRAFIRVNEALHDKAIAEIADVIARKGSRIILVAGPSSSGKTTTTGRLAIHLRVLGLDPVVISLDNYYRARAEQPLEADGSIDLESLHAIDVPLFRAHMQRLLLGETVEIPRYSFQTGNRMEHGVPVKLHPGQPVLVEGIHGLNPALVEGIDESVIHRIFVSALSCINLDDHNRIRTTDVRLLRRIVRDNQFRATPPEETLAMWPSVRKGEEKWVFPYQELADSMLNTALHYELPVLGHYVYGLLKAISPESPCYLTARRLVKMLNYFPDIPEAVLEEIPPLSLLREFIGGCTIDQEG